jgi:hypothetical protein
VLFREWTRAKGLGERRNGTARGAIGGWAVVQQNSKVAVARRNLKFGTRAVQFSFAFPFFFLLFLPFVVGLVVVLLQEERLTMSRPFLFALVSFFFTVPFCIHTKEEDVEYGLFPLCQKHFSLLLLSRGWTCAYKFSEGASIDFSRGKTRTGRHSTTARHRTWTSQVDV